MHMNKLFLWFLRYLSCGRFNSFKSVWQLKRPWLPNRSRKWNACGSTWRNRRSRRRSSEGTWTPRGPRPLQTWRISDIGRSGRKRARRWRRCKNACWQCRSYWSKVRPHKENLDVAHQPLFILIDARNMAETFTEKVPSQRLSHTRSPEFKFWVDLPTVHNASSCAIRRKQFVGFAKHRNTNP